MEELVSLNWSEKNLNNFFIIVLTILLDQSDCNIIISIIYAAHTPTPTPTHPPPPPHTHAILFLMNRVIAQDGHCS